MIAVDQGANIDHHVELNRTVASSTICFRNFHLSLGGTERESDDGAHMN